MKIKHNRRDWLGDFDFLGALFALVFGSSQPALKPVPVRVRRR